MRKRRRRGVSAGSLLMLAVTLLVVAACCIFLLGIAGEDVYERTGALIRSLSERGFIAPQGTQAPVAQDAPPAPTATTPPAQPEDAQAAAGWAQIGERVASFSLAAAGTVCAPRAVRTAAQTGTGYDFNPVFAGLGNLMRDADLSLATLETLTAGEESGYGSYNAPPQLLDALRSAGVSVLSLATERALDKGYGGLELTQRELNTRSMLAAGADASGEGLNKRTLNINGVQVAVLAYAYGLSDEGRTQTNGDERGALALLDEAGMVRDITNARLNGANVVIVMPHWGTKNRAETPDDVRTLAQRLAEAGADIILGAHPNVVQGTERLKVTRSDGLEYETVVCYSLGCLLTDAREAKNTAGMIARLTVRYDASTRRVELGELVSEPVYIACQQENGAAAYRVVDATDPAMTAALNDEERQAAALAAQSVREVTGQSEWERAGQG